MGYYYLPLRMGGVTEADVGFPTVIAQNFTIFYRRIFKIFQIMFFFHGWHPEKLNCRGKLLHTHPLLKFLYL